MRSVVSVLRQVLDDDGWRGLTLCFVWIDICACGNSLRYFYMFYQEQSSYVKTEYFGWKINDIVLILILCDSEPHGGKVRFINWQFTMGKRCSSTVMPGCTEPPECSEPAGHRTAAGKERERERERETTLGRSGPGNVWSLEASSQGEYFLV